MDKFIEGFKEKITNKDIGGIPFEYITAYSHFGCFVFVEGMLDITFYSNIINERANDKNYKFINCHGKPNVIKSLNYLGNNNLFNDK